MIKKKIWIIMLLFATIILFAGIASAQEEQLTRDQVNNNKTLLILGCAIAVGISGISAATGLTFSGASAVAVAAEKPNIGSKLLVLQVLPMTQSVYGLLTAILMLMGSGLLGGTETAVMTTNPIIGPAAIFIGIVVALTSTSAINQGILASSSINAVGRNPDVFTKGIIYTVTTEAMAIFGLLTAIFIMVGLQLL
ncbi:MAG: V-type ATP synthase subunit K [Candidatus Thermoplasmatota archaeon]|nr:V-type ATP synthase subunit K [Candidatus Thermoplasmatota archaeon]